MRQILMFVLPACGLGVAMLPLLKAGRRIGIWRRSKNPDRGDKESGAVDVAIFGLMALLIAFTFSGAASRFDERRHLIVEEAELETERSTMIDITTTRGMALKMRPPPVIFVMLAVLVLVSSLLAGYGMAASAKRN